MQDLLENQTSLGPLLHLRMLRTQCVRPNWQAIVRAHAFAVVLVRSLTCRQLICLVALLARCSSPKSHRSWSMKSVSGSPVFRSRKAQPFPTLFASLLALKSHHWVDALKSFPLIPILRKWDHRALHRRVHPTYKSRPIRHVELHASSRRLLSLGPAGRRSPKP